MKTRLAKFLSDSGVASRRSAERLIESGIVSVNDAIVNTPVYFVENGDIVKLNGKLVEPRTDTILIILNKPIDTLTSLSDPQGRKTIYDVLPVEYKNLKYIGRLDYRTEGLLLLTNNGELARFMTLPKSGLIRTYRARVHGKCDEKILDRARRGIIIDGVHYSPMKIKILKSGNTNTEIELKLAEGKNNEIRIVMGELGLDVAKLVRTNYGPFELDDIPIGKIRVCSKKEVDQIIKKMQP